ncbi:Phosphotransferase system cellobiose-specific component IIC [Spiroplasma gladiatoris]|uniref:Phosphotransferase system cellobiose-specific component IIC n=1 Tax=Spiroplasma gladiatoris TaxID=2143 RepID=A0A4P7AHT0_9MOLU|nr:PTS transporter subunit EIIC [Spiroplasma gladiatoris]QBQ07772.1 Phosphotransferase system cellobiose-specific component IIC [Spiroplasma gladiatoris]
MNKEKNVKKSFKNWFNSKFVPALTKVGNERHISALKDTFGTMLAIIIAGSIGLLIQAIIFGGAGSGRVSLLGVICKFATNESWDFVHKVITTNVSGYTSWYKIQQIAGQAFGVLNTATIGSMSLYFAFIYGFFIAKSRNFKSPLLAATMSVALFIVCIMGQVSYFMGATGLIIAIFSSIVGVEIFIKLSNVKKFEIKLPAGVPPNVGKSFAILIPAILTFGVFVLINLCFLTPALLTNMSVGKGDYSTLTEEKIQEILNTYKDMSAEDIVAKIMNNQNFIDHSEVVNKVADILKNSKNSKEFFENIKSFYELSNESDKSVIANAIAYLNNIENELYSITSGGKISFVETDGVLLMNVKYQIVSIGSEFFGVGAGIYKFFGSWFEGFAKGNGGLALAIVYVFFVSFFWFFGIHGSNLLAGIFEPIWYMIAGINVTLISKLGYDLAAQTGDLGIFTYSFVQSYYMIGGSGCTLGLIIGTLMFSRRRELREIAKYAAPSGIFQINEPVVFGFPIVLNPVYAAPWFLVPILSIVTGYLFTTLGWVKYSYITVPWTTPWMLGAIITSTDWKQIIPTTITLGLSFGIYLPFVFLDNILYMKKLKKDDIDKYNEVKKYWSNPEYKFITNKNEKLYHLEDYIYDTKSKIDELKSKEFKKASKKEKSISKLKEFLNKLIIKKAKYEIYANKIIESKKDKWNKINLKKQQKENKKISKNV